MCHLCVEIDRNIANLADMADRGSPETGRSIDILIAELQDRKAALHPDYANPSREPQT
jgi:hypothetical protein